MAHEKRAQHIPYLKEKLGDVPVFMDKAGVENIGLWENAKRCWLSFDPEADYHLVVQDDSIVTDNFYEKLDKILDNGPKYAYCLFFRYKSYKTHKEMNQIAMQRRGNGFFTYPRLQWANAIVLPTKIIKECIEYADQQKKYKNIDDLRISEYLNSISMLTYYPLPSLVNHREEESLIGNGSNKGRTATWYE